MPRTSDQSDGSSDSDEYERSRKVSDSGKHTSDDDLDERDNSQSKSKSRSDKKSSRHSRKDRSRSRRSRSREKRKSRSRSPSRRDKHRSKRSRSRDRYHSPKRSRSHRRSRSCDKRDRRDRNYRSRRSRSRSSSYERSRRRSQTPPRIRRKREFYKTLQASSVTISHEGGCNSEKPSDLPLTASGMSGMTTQLAAQHAMATTNARTGISLPKYYNPAAINPLKYAEQMQKRKLLWKNKTEPETTMSKPTSNWNQLSFSQDQDGKVAAKFKKLMGIKGNDAEGSGKGEAMEKQEQLFRGLDQQYEMARISTHTQRGVGLGFSSQFASSSGMFPK